MLPVVSGSLGNSVKLDNGFLPVGRRGQYSLYGSKETRGECGALASIGVTIVNDPVGLCQVGGYLIDLSHR
jgi:hypothetical protein